jgi:hypothetical protein
MPGSGRQLPSPPSTGEDRKAPARLFRLRKYPGRNPQQGDMVIRGVVRARLLGMQLLTLEARVVVGTGNGDRSVVSSLILSPHDPSGPDVRSPRPKRVATGSGTGFAHAIELLEQSTETLERSRRPS